MTRGLSQLFKIAIAAQLLLFASDAAADQRDGEIDPLLGAVLRELASGCHDPAIHRDQSLPGVGNTGRMLRFDAGSDRYVSQIIRVQQSVIDAARTGQSQGAIETGSPGSNAPVVLEESTELTQAELGAELHELYEGHTEISCDPAIGFTVRFFDREGIVFQWQGGLELTAIGLWSVETRLPARLDSIALCVRFADTAWLPSASRPAPESCRSALMILMSSVGIIGRREGDQFNLMDGAVPFVRGVWEMPVWPEGATE